MVISPIRQAARVGQMSGSEIVVPKRTGRPTGYWVGENEDRTETQSAYGQVAIPSHEMACYVDCSIKLLEDSAFDLNSEIGLDLAEEFGRLEGAAFVSGDTPKQPQGLLTSSEITSLASGAATTITADALIDVFYDLKAPYRNTSSWVMNGTTIAAVRKLKNGEGEYIWQPGLQPNQPSTLLGRPVIEAPDMPNVGAGAYPILFGDFLRGYRVYDRMNGMSILRDPYSMATVGVVRFHARRRVGGAVVKAEALRKIKIATSV